ncbi:MAG TPA: hypothetical protein PKA18_04115 [Ottowia sp.]|jgi:uncharacterized membrane protein|nr:MAG: hypothetical protein BGO36_03445 [Burkholderiales bacterium 68-10]HMT57659.1 hypothetical protein [Ottowia sp.]HMT82631.1 hypothetical protein [Ottowia sp.]HOK12161.1 hypothetical protein [Ottowia sp.]HON29795.1 hypothetical protein [Ottowia sp.]
MSRNDIIDVEPVGSRREDSLKTWGWVSYLLHLIVAVAAVVPGAQVSIALLVIALVLDLVKKDDAVGSWQASHFSWRIRSVLWAGVLYVVTFPLFLLFYLPGAIAWAIISIWFLYRIVLGMVRMNAGRPVEH